MSEEDRPRLVEEAMSAVRSHLDVEEKLNIELANVAEMVEHDDLDVALGRAMNLAALRGVRMDALKAERDRLLNAAKTAWVNIGHAEWCGQLDHQGVACDCGMSDLRDLIFITPKEESRG